MHQFTENYDGSITMAVPLEPMEGLWPDGSMKWKSILFRPVGFSQAKDPGAVRTRSKHWRSGHCMWVFTAWKCSACKATFIVADMGDLIHGCFYRPLENQEVETRPTAKKMVAGF